MTSFSVIQTVGAFLQNQQRGRAFARLWAHRKRVTPKRGGELGLLELLLN
jgi:hypothetical protein